MLQIIEPENYQYVFNIVIYDDWSKGVGFL